METMLTKALFACLMSRTFSANEQCFPLTTNQPTLLSAMAYQPRKQTLIISCLLKKIGAQFLKKKRWPPTPKKSGQSQTK
jgi:hypothetical protein